MGKSDSYKMASTKTNQESDGNLFLLPTLLFCVKKFLNFKDPKS